MGIVGRGRELERLGSWLDAARAGSGRLVLCVGEAGIGKTRLAQEFAGMALATGVAVAWGRCVETEGAPPYWPWRQILRSLSLDPDRVLTATEDRFRLYEELIDVLRTAAASRGLLIILDDVHRGDDPSLLVLRQLADQLPDLPVLTLATSRSGPGSGSIPGSGLLLDLLRARSAERLDLHGFDLADVRSQLPEASTRAGRQGA